MRSVLTAAALVAAGLLGVRAAGAASLTHSYDLNGSYADALGGPSLVGAGGTLGADTYKFGVNQGLALSGALPAAGNSYSIELSFEFDATTGYRKIIDFKDRTTDQGLYDYGGALAFYGGSSGSTGAFTPGAYAHVVLTRDAAGTTTGYVNGTQQFSFTDSSTYATFSKPGSIIHFFHDDTVNGGEASAGAVDFIRIYDGALTAAEVSALPTNDRPVAVPTPAAASAGLALLGLLAAARRTARTRLA